MLADPAAAFLGAGAVFSCLLANSLHPVVQNGVAALITKNNTDGTPSRSSASAMETLLGAGLVWDMKGLQLDCRGSYIQYLVVRSQARSHPVVQNSIADRGFGLGDKHPQRAG